MLITEEPYKNKTFVAEAHKLAVIYTTCTKTVAGEHCYKNYINDLPEKFKS